MYNFKDLEISKNSYFCTILNGYFQKNPHKILVPLLFPLTY